MADGGAGGSGFQPSAPEAGFGGNTGNGGAGGRRNAASLTFSMRPEDEARRCVLACCCCAASLPGVHSSRQDAEKFEADSPAVVGRDDIELALPPLWPGEKAGRSFCFCEGISPRCGAAASEPGGSAEDRSILHDLPVRNFGAGRAGVSPQTPRRSDTKQLLLGEVSPLAFHCAPIQGNGGSTSATSASWSATESSTSSMGKGSLPSHDQG
mmetsp:Transcript_7066/g.15211  ORF Transcript_7066/g.15211 Transcript_7066/m.15211 type:complete len:211 (+) Transcript_7066:393-1025(+)